MLCPPQRFCQFFIQVGRRAQVRTGDGFVGWLSFSTAENVPIAQKVRLEGSAGKADLAYDGLRKCKS